MKRLSLTFVFLGACNGDDPPDLAATQPSTCLDYATALLGECFDAVRTSDNSELQCDSGLLEAGYNACNLVLEAGQSVCIPYRKGTGWAAAPSSSKYTSRHGCSATVSPPAPKNWRGTDPAQPGTREPDDLDRPERDP